MPVTPGSSWSTSGRPRSTTGSAAVDRIGVARLGALEAIHERGIVHRDVKPGNVLVDDGGHVVLTDFGIATIEGDTRFTASGFMVGTPGYMAPERLAGERDDPAS